VLTGTMPSPGPAAVTVWTVGVLIGATHPGNRPVANAAVAARMAVAIVLMLIFISRPFRWFRAVVHRCAVIVGQVG
jgi:hypothetical protein